MDGILSQDEINALLSGMDLSGDNTGTDATAAPAASEESMSVPADTSVDGTLLTDTEKDAIGEIANISMGASATTLYSLVNRKVNITTPTVTLSNWEEVIRDYQRPFVFIQIRYTIGLDGSTIMVLNEQDVKIITDLMMGGDGKNIMEGEIGELHLSAISEAMNQMMGSSATSMSTMLGKKIDISPPEATRVDLQEPGSANEVANFLTGTFVKVSFRMQIDDLIDSIIMQLYPIDFAKNLYEIFMTAQDPEPAFETAAPQEPQPYIPPVVEQPQMTPPPMQEQPQMTPPPMPDMSQTMAQPGMGTMQMGMQPDMNMNMGMGMGYQMPNMGMPGMNMNMGMGYQMPPMQPDMSGMNVQPAQFQSFNNTNTVAGQENIGLIMDVPLEVTVELGRTKKSISEILEFAPGTIIELDKIAGEPVDVLVNGKFVAKGEVVVIEESFGVRVTEIIK